MGLTLSYCAGNPQNAQKILDLRSAGEKIFTSIPTCSSNHIVGEYMKHILLSALGLLSMPLYADGVKYVRSEFDANQYGVRALYVMFTNEGNQPAKETVTARVKAKDGSTMNFRKEETIPAHAGLTFEITGMPADASEATIEWRGKAVGTVKAGALPQAVVFPATGKDCSKSGVNIPHGARIRDKGKIQRCNNGNFQLDNTTFTGFCPSSFSTSQQPNGIGGDAKFRSMDISPDRARVTCSYEVNASMTYRVSSNAHSCEGDPKRPRHVTCTVPILGPIASLLEGREIGGRNFAERIKVQVLEYEKIQTMGLIDSKWISGNQQDSSGQVELIFESLNVPSNNKSFTVTYKSTDARLQVNLPDKDFSGCKSAGKDKFTCEANVVKEF